MSRRLSYPACPESEHFRTLTQEPEPTVETTSLTIAEAHQVPAHLEDLARRTVEFAEASLSAGTRRKYATAWRQFETWCTRTGFESLPARPEVVAMYLTHRVETGCSVSTVELDGSAINAAHEAMGIDSPTRDRVVRRVMKGIRRTKGTRPTQKSPVSVKQLRRMVAALPDTNRGARDHLVLVLGFASAMRREELAALDTSDVEEVEDGLRVVIRRSKTDQEGRGRTIGIPYGSHPSTCPVRVLRQWLEVSEITCGPLLRSIDAADRLGDTAMSDRAVARCVQRAAGHVGLDPAKVGGHSLRSGFATEAARAGASERSIAKQTGHQSMAVLRGYIREGTLFQDNAAAHLGL